MSIDRVHYLLQRLFHHECTPDEKDELALWIDTLQNDEEWKLRLGKIWNSYEPVEKIDPAKADTILKKILHENKQEFQPVQPIHSRHTSLPSRMMKWAVAAAAVIGILIVLSIIFLTKRPVNTGNALGVNNISNHDEIRPGGNKATLTLANGSKIILDSANTGALAQQGNMRVILGNGLLSYKLKSKNQTSLNLPTGKAGQTSEIEYNTLSTPRGGQYRVKLPDGSEVWLNATSSIRFPTAFTGKERRVEITGEAYFEIARNAAMPFVVQVKSSNGQDEGTIRVLGTHFNINAYAENAPVAATLLEGSVKVESGKEKQILKPGEQALMGKNNILIKKDVNLHEVIAWKNGLFDFEGNNIRDVMQQIARWYDVDVKYENISPAHFMGTISRSSNISEVLKMLEMTGAVHFKVEGRTVTVTR